MAHSGCSALHGANLNYKKTTKNHPILQLNSTNLKKVVGVMWEASYGVFFLQIEKIIAPKLLFSWIVFINF